MSVDIDLNYVGAVDRDTMLVERPHVERAIAAVCGRSNLAVRRVPTDHAGGKWRLSYTSVSGRAGTLELDVNFMLREPLWPIRIQDSRPLEDLVARGVPVLDLHELAAGKLAALLSRSAARDLFDVRGLLQRAGLDHDLLRVGFVVYGGIARRDWRTVSVEDVIADESDVARQLLPMLRADVAPTSKSVAEWTRALVEECRSCVELVLPLRPQEVEFLNALNDRGVISPELLTGDLRLQDVIRRHPALLWKAQNVQAYRGRG